MASMPKPAALRPPLVFGWNLPNPGTSDLLRVIKIIESVGISFVSLNLNSAEEGQQNDNFVPLCGSDLVLTYNYWSQRIVARIDSVGGAFMSYMEWSAYLGLRAVCIHCEPIFQQATTLAESHELLANLAQRLKAFLHSPNMPTVCLSFAANDVSWGYWNAIHEMTNYSPQLKVAIVIDDDDAGRLARWVAEPLTAVILRESSFVRVGETVQLKPALVPHLHFLLQYDVKVMLSGMFNFEPLRKASELRSADSLELIAIRDLDTPPMPGGIGVREAITAVRKAYAAMPPLTEAEQFKEGFWDMLQEPLQPVRDNLETATYENFERCTRKYAQYEAAVSLWLKDFMAGALPGQAAPGEGDNGNHEGHNGVRRPVIYIVGAGRGPLVDCSLRALAENNVTEFSIYALEKNPATVFTLKHKIATNAIKGWDKVKLIFQDMRTLKPSEPADLVLSELLGSFGDNELAPECLDGVQNAFQTHFPGHRVTFMPCTYVSYAEPIYAPKVWASLNLTQIERPFQHPYTVALHKFCKVAEQPKPCFKFEHPNKQMKGCCSDTDDVQALCYMNNEHNNRYSCMSFKSTLECFIHGFAGYFECTLYKDVKISTVPGVMDDQISWFPMYFPITAPIYVKEGQLVMLHVWRKHDKRRMWYEWALTLPHVTGVHNSNGTCHSILR
ncbi:skb1 methyltransferase family protein, putative [Babesia bigemina]|uniref:Protein arginine N-methyltransferase n=1 Tax=Babesia bigemina TaxID=5866 RepID=A0A061DET4_BABBI|nr:skb1 methyltransferase family protein, putative [Babesia bigemina]CDR97835.1 skb1 methyltransferase family protein, putative [Babesia bigemina]|eukprot:XP_012770021.1 skb1 methyltransferase family protein, putative [Babesia bigemina]